MNSDTIQIYVELLDEGSPTLRPTTAQDVGKGLFKLLPTPDYDPEDESWAFLPGDIVRAEKSRSSDGTSMIIAKHPNPDVIRIDVEQVGKNSSWLRTTHALSLGDGLYKILATPRYDPKNENWKFPPDSVVRLKEIKSPDGKFTFVVATDSHD